MGRRTQNMIAPKEVVSESDALDGNIAKFERFHGRRNPASTAPCRHREH